MRWTVHLEGGPRRVNHAAVTVGEKIFSFGGYCTGEDYKASQPMDIHILNTVSLRWLTEKRDRVKTPFPFQRYGHTAVAHGDCVYIWGGRNDLRACNTLYCYNTVTQEWIKPCVSGNIPGARDGHSACNVNGRMYIFGGYEEIIDRFSQAVYAFDFRSMTWHHVNTKGLAPRRRDFHSATCVDSNMYIFGGRGGQLAPYNSNDEVYCNRISYLDTVQQTWIEPQVNGEKPSGRRSHSAFFYNGNVYIFGGYNGIQGTHFQDLWLYNPASSQWSEMKVPGDGPCKRRRQCCCVCRDKMFLFGGTSPYPAGLRPPESVEDVANIGGDLMDHSDLYVLDFAPSLKTLCEVSVIHHKLDSSFLPKDIRWELMAMTTNNSISRPLNNAG